MSGKTLDLNNVITRDQLAVEISHKYSEWSSLRNPKVDDWTELRRYLYATDTTTTTNSSLPWKNKTTIPKLTQIRDNLYANYMKALFPKRKWLTWIAFDDESDKADKKKLIEDFMYYVIDRSKFKQTVSKLVLDFIDYGNVIALPGWVDNSTKDGGKLIPGYTGPVAQRVSPLDIVFNPIAPSFEQSPKIVRSLVSMGEIKKLVDAASTEEDKEFKTEIWNYMQETRQHVAAYTGGQDHTKDLEFQVDGFGSFTQYLGSSYVDILTFYGDIYDVSTGKFYENHIIQVVDRHKIFSIRPNPSSFGVPQIFHAGWRERQDNLWAMGPLDNLVGLQYRIDHLENLKADVFDLVTYPPLKIKGYVEDFTWGPMERILVGDDGDVDLMSPDVQALNVNIEISQIEAKMEEMAGAPKEALGIRTPGEKTAYEVQRLENAASRVFQTKIQVFEEQIIEPLLNAMLEMAHRLLPSNTLIRIFDDEVKVATFQTISKADLTGNGRIVPMAARHFAEYAEKVQNITAFFSSPVGQDPEVKQHFSAIKIAEMFDDLLDVSGYQLVQPYIRITEQADAQRLIQSNQEQVGMEAMTPSGLTPDDNSQPKTPPTLPPGGLNGD